MVSDNVMVVDEVVFLTRGEIHIHSEDNLSIHLRPKDGRLKDISRLMSQKKLKFVTIDPIKDKFYKGFFPGNWYLIPTLEYTGSADHSGYVHFSFRYKLENSYYWDKKGVRTLTTQEIDNVRNKLSLL